MNFKSKIALSLFPWILVILVTFNIEFVRSVIVDQQIANSTCQPITYLKDQKMFKCELKLYSNHLSARLILNFNRLQLKCSDTFSIYDSSNISGDPRFNLTCENTTGSVIYSTNNSLSLKFVTGDDLGFNSNDFHLVYTSFNETNIETYCDGFICRDENRCCISREFQCDGYYHCGDGSDESYDCMMSSDASDRERIRLIALICFASFILLLGTIWLCAHTRKLMRNRAVIQRNGVVNN